MYIHIPLISLHKYRSVYGNHRLFRKPPLLGPPLSCADVNMVDILPRQVRPRPGLLARRGRASGAAQRDPTPRDQI